LSGAVEKKMLPKRISDFAARPIDLLDNRDIINKLTEAPSSCGGKLPRLPIRKAKKIKNGSASKQRTENCETVSCGFLRIDHR